MPDFRDGKIPGRPSACLRVACVMSSMCDCRPSLLDRPIVTVDCINCRHSVFNPEISGGSRHGLGWA